MALSKENLLQLIALQERDAALDKLKAEMDKIPVEIASLRGGLESGKGRLSEVKGKVISFEKKKKERELELAQKEEAARKHGAELNAVKTNEAFRALQVEIGFAKQAASEIETEILELMEAIDLCRKEERALQAELGGLEKKVSSEVAAHEARLAALKSEFDVAKESRDRLASPLPGEATRVYDHVRSRGKLNAVVAIDGDRCSACNMTQAPQVIVEATKAKQLVTCESCQRIIYRPQSQAAKAA